MSERASQPLPAPANLTKEPQEFSLADNVKRLLADPELVGTPETQGRAVVDTFVGELVANGGVTNSGGEHYDPAEILEQIDQASELVTWGKMTWDQARQHFSGRDGLRQALDAMIGDDRTKTMFGEMSRQVGRGADGTIALASVKQVSSYLEALAREHGQPDTDWSKLTTAMWRHAIKNDAEYVREPSSPFRVSDSARFGMNDSEKARQDAFDRALIKANEIGADDMLLELSADEIRNRYQERQQIGRIAT